MTKNFSICVGTLGTGAWHSMDGGETWKRVAKGLWGESRIFGLAVHPKEPQTIYAGADDGVYRSRDQGQSFEHLDSPMNAMDVWKIALDPVNPDTIFAGTRPAALFRSRDGGQHWEQLTVDMAEECANVRIPRVTALTVDPSDHRVVTLINTMIKNRDFWMPFAPSILRERESDYVVNPKGLASPYMMLAFPTNPKRREEIVAAVHPHDGTARAHIVDEAWNPGYYRVIREFERRTGVGAVLNTSFNLHGEPLVGSPADAVDTFERSGLPHLALGRWLISKK